MSWLCVGSSTGFCISSSARYPRTVRLTCAVSSLIRTAEQLLINREALIRSTCLVGVEDYYSGDGIDRCRGELDVEAFAARRDF